MNHPAELIDRIKQRLAGQKSPDQPAKPGLTPAAVLLPLYLDASIWKLLYIRRGNQGEFHRGEVAFPGGAVEPEDADRAATALRETHEELGIAASAVQVLGQMPIHETVTGYIVTPVIGLLRWPVSITRSQAEVDRVFSIPLDWLMQKENSSIQKFDIPGHGQISTTVYKDFDGERLWGFSARVTQQFIDLIKQK
ncbi:MAG: CoA pyrophosphatase [Anaerolineaceae bacterium]|jgi:8-oxo-dGTP pyrophosphatase MutT (NUDIX family)|nr:CoA pyrophosphatase [Anaerolineaceae bacterium]